ncbi:MAG: hypothetical protein LBI40_01925 [Treponema sp.]|jgi:hypothetical protein|nr:hypothetical protein [Treponema sp.]
MPSYRPTKEAEYVDWSENLIEVSEKHKVEWKLVDGKLTELRTLHDEVKALHELCQTASYTKLDMQAKNEKKALLIHLEEVFVRNNLQNNDAMTDNGREELGIPIHDPTPTPQPAPTTIPEVEVETPHPRTVRIKFRDEHTKRWGKPTHVHGLECLWLIAEEPPAKVKDLLHSEFATRNPLELTFEEDERGKKVYFAVRWESGAGKKGLWSDIYSAIIP